MTLEEVVDRGGLQRAWVKVKPETPRRSWQSAWDVEFGARSAGEGIGNGGEMKSFSGRSERYSRIRGFEGGSSQKELGKGCGWSFRNKSWRREWGFDSQNSEDYGVSPKTDRLSATKIIGGYLLIEFPNKEGRKILGKAEF